MTVGADGKPREITVEEAHGPGELARQLRDAVKQWRFEPESIAGSAYPTRLRQDFNFSVQEAAVPPIAKCPEDVSDHVRLPGQSSCLPIFEVSIEMDNKTLGREMRVDNPR
jgi:TonB family protein